MSAKARTFVLLTPEYPPDCGGIGDYVALLGARLADGGDRVRVFTRSPSQRAHTPGVEVALLPDHFGAQTRRYLAHAWQTLPKDAVVLVQYVPQGFGWKGMNLPFARFLAGRTERLWLMLHEIVYPFIPGQRVQLDVLAAFTRLMLRVSTARAERAFVSTPAWEPIFERYARPGLRCEWLPIPATAAAADGVPRHAPAAIPTIAHFGTYGRLIAEPLERIVVPLLGRCPELELVLVGRGSDTFRNELAERHPELDRRLRATGAAAPERISEELARAWVTIFPFEEGVTTRRTSLMTALAAGAVIVTTDAWCTESVWRRSGAVELVDGYRSGAAVEAVIGLLSDGARRELMRQRARALYAERFHVDRVAERLREHYAAPAVRAASSESFVD
jgi:glycosyltransferase involved in cell wall biosynthesis